MGRLRCCRNRAWPALVTGVLIIGVGQTGRLPVPKSYRSAVEKRYSEVMEDATDSALRADIIVMGDSRIAFGLASKELASTLRFPKQGHKPPVVVSLAIPGGDFASDLWLWWRVTRAGRPKVRLLIVGVSEMSVMAKYPGRDIASRYHCTVRDLGWLIAGGQLADAAAVLTYRAFPLYAGRQRIVDFLRRQTHGDFIPDALTARYTADKYGRMYKNYCVEGFQVRCLERLIGEAQAARAQVFLVAPPIDRSLLLIAEEGFPAPGATQDSGFPRSESRAQAPLTLLQRTVFPVAARFQVPYLNYLTSKDSARFEYWDASHLSTSLSGGVLFTNDVVHKINQVLARRPLRTS